jgi:tetratricopeptide (TPR) repeat protein
VALTKLRAALLLLVLLGSTATAWAAPARSALAAANEHVAVANRAFQAGRYDKAIEELRVAYQLAPRAEFLLSFAQVYRAAGRTQEALEACHAYLAMVPTGPMATTTRQLVTLLEAERQRKEASAHEPAPAPPTPPPAPAEPAPAPPPPPPAAAAAATLVAAPQPTDDGGAHRRKVILGVTLGAVGLAVVGLTVGLAVGLSGGRHPSLGTLDFTPP